MKKIAFLFTVVFWQITFSRINVTITGQQNPEIGVANSYQIQASKKTDGSAPQNSTGIVIQQYVIQTLYNGSGSQVNGTINNVITQFDVVNTSLNLINRSIVWGDWSDNPYDEINVTLQGYFVNSNGDNIGNFDSAKSNGKLVINKQTIQITGITGNKTVPKCCSDNQTYSVQSTGNSFSWSVSGGATIIGSNTGSSITVTPPITGNYSVTVTARRTGASQNYFRTATGNVTRTDRSIIFTPTYPNGNTYGFDYICKSVGRVMQLENQCGVSSVNWVAPNCTISGQGTTNPTITPNSTVANGSSINVYAVVTFTGGCTATTPTKSFQVFDSSSITAPQGYLVATSNTGDICTAEVFNLTYVNTDGFVNGITTISPDFLFPATDPIHNKPRTIKVCRVNLCTGQTVCTNYTMSAPEPCVTNKMATSTLTISPNPNNGEFTINFPQEISGEYFVFDISGMQIKQGKINKSKSENVKLQNNLRQGNYIIKVITNDKKEFSQNILIK